MRFPEMLWPFWALPGNYLCLDSETTGLPDKDGMPAIVSLGFTEVENKKIVSSTEYMIRPEREISEEAKSVHGIESERAATFDDLRSQWPIIKEKLSGKLIVIHNASFDWPILLEQLNKNDLPTPSLGGIFCSQKSAYPWALANEIECSNRGPSLDTLTQVLAVENLRTQQQGIHGAMIDSQQTAFVVEKLRELFRP